jgi:Cys-rich repeat protein
VSGGFRSLGDACAAGMLLFACSSDYVTLDLLAHQSGAAGAASDGCADECDNDWGLCSPELGRCVECLAHSDCTHDYLPLCDPTSGECVQCLSSTDCDSIYLPACDPASRRCVQCLASADCPGGEACSPSLGVCVEPCATSDACDGDTPLCDPTSRTCVECLVSSDCTGSDETCDPDRLVCTGR